MAGVDADFFERFERKRMHLTLWFGTRTIYLKQVARGCTQDTFSHVATARISCAENENFWFGHYLVVIKGTYLIA